MDTEKLRRRQNIKVIISEIIMVIAMVVTVAVLALVVSGYWLNSDFEVERQGMLQISSIPSGAHLTIDGEEPSWFQRTNTSKILSSGEHEIVLTKDGYDSWSRKINISEGLLYRIHYPRLFLNERESEKVFDMTKFTFATVSPSRKTMLLLGSTTEWTLLNLENETLKPEKLDVSNLFLNATVSSAEPATDSPEDTKPLGVFTGEIKSYAWDKNNEHILFKVSGETATEWVLLDVANIKNSINLTKEFGIEFATIKIFDNSASTLLALENGNLRKIDTKNKTLSANLATNVFDFDYYDNEIIFGASRPATSQTETTSPGSDNLETPTTKPYYLGSFRLGSSNIEEYEDLAGPFKLAILQFYDNKYIATLSEKHLTLHEKSDYEKVSSFDLSFNPNGLLVGHQGEFITLTGDGKIATLDMEDNGIREWSVDGEKFEWLTGDMIFSVKNGELFVYDFDGLNRRSLAKNVSSHFPVTITNEKWLYYFSDGNLMREVVSK